MSKRWVWMGLWIAAGLVLGSGAQAKLLPGTTNALPRLVTKRGESFALGKKPYPKGTREKWVAEGRVLARAPEGVLPKRQALKGAADNRGILPPIKSQGSEGSCVHWAGAYYTKTANMKRNDPALNVTLASNQCSPRFTYNLTNAGEDNGAYGHEPFEIFMRYGGASLLQKPYVAGQYTALPVVADFVEGLHRRTTNYVWVWGWNPTTVQINELKAWLDAGGVAACAVYAEDTFDAWGKGDAPWVGTECSEYDINHMVTVCGYGPGYYLVANSWGTSFGSNGYIVVDAGYFENFFSDVMYPLEGTYEPATSYAQVQIDHGRRSDIRSLSFTVNGATVWSNAPLPRNAPQGTGSYDTDTRDGWALAVDLSRGSWGAANTVTARCLDRVSGTAGSLTSFSVMQGGRSHVSSNTPVAIPDNTGAAALAWVSVQPPAALDLLPASTNVGAAAASGRTLAVTGTVVWTAATNAPWLAITAGRAGTNNGTVVYSVAANAGLAARTGAITVAGGGLARTCTVVQAGAAPAVGNLIVGLAVPGQAGATMANLIYGGSLGSPVYTFHVPHGAGIASLAPTITLASGAVASPASGTARNFTAPLVPYTVTYGGQARTNYARCVVLAPAAATAGTSYDMGAPVLRDIWVDPVNGSDTTGNGTTRARAYRTINRAWADVPMSTRFSTTGYRLMLCAGTYADDRSWMEHRYGTYETPLVLEAADGAGTAVVAYDMQFFSCNYVYLRGLVFEPDNGGDGLHLDSCEFVLIKDCAIRGGPGTQRLGREGLKANQSEYLYVEDCEIANAYGNALDYMCCHYGHIRRSRIHDADDWAAYVKGGSSDFLIEGNEFYNGGTGGFVAGQGAGSEFLTAPWIHYQASNVRFVNNVVRDCDGAGFGVNGGHNILFAYNTLYRVGSRSHGIEIAFGNDSLDGAAEAPIAQTYLQWGGWTHTSTAGDQRIPNRNIYVYNNILYNPMPFQSEWQHFEFTGPWEGNTNPNIPWPATTDENLQIKGNILWNGPPSLELGIWSDTACQPDNPTCNATLLPAQNHINQLLPQLVDPAGGDFRPVGTGNVNQAVAYAIPAFPADGALSPAEPAGELNNVVLLDRAGFPRDQSGPPGAYVIGAGLTVTPASRSVGAAAGTTTFVVTNAGGGTVAYAASEAVAWLSISSGGTGTNFGTIGIAYDANGGTAARTGRVVVAGGGNSRTCTVVQAGMAPATRWAYPSGVPWPVPGLIEIENFDVGGAGVTYADTTTANEGGKYRTGDGVDIAAVAGAGNGYMLGWAKAGEWLEYTVNVATSGTYTLEARYSALGSGGQIRMLVDGTDRTGLVALPNTGSWTGYQLATKTGIDLATGIHTVRVALATAGTSGYVGIFDWFRLSTAVAPPPPPARQAYPNGVPWPVPGVVEIENFDMGGAGVTYYDTTTANEGGKYRTTEGVDIAAVAGAGNGYMLGWAKAGEWLEYTVNVATSGTYTLEARYSALGSGGQIRMLVDGTDRTGLVALPNTGSWTAYQLATKTGIDLTTGIHTVRVALATAGTSGYVGIFDWFRLSSSVAPPPPPARQPYPNGVPWAVPGVVEIENFDMGGAGVTYYDTTTANEGGKYRTTEGVDIAAVAGAGNGYMLGWAKAGEWLEYTVNAAVSGTYALEVRYSALGSGGQIRVLVDGADRTGVMALPNSGSWTSYRLTGALPVELTSGSHTVRVAMVATGTSGYVGIFDWFRFSATAGKAARGQVPGLKSLAASETGVPVAWARDGQSGWVLAPELVDGDEDTIWRGTPEARSWAVALDFGERVPLQAVDIVYENSPWTKVGALGTADMMEWRDLDGGDPGPVACRILYLDFREGDGDAAPAIREIDWAAP